MGRYARRIYLESINSALPCFSTYVCIYCLVNQYQVLLNFHRPAARVEPLLSNPIER